MEVFKSIDKKNTDNVRVFVRKFRKTLIISVYRGAGGSRTLVQTRKQYAFYMLIFILFVG